MATSPVKTEVASVLRGLIKEALLDNERAARRSGNCLHTQFIGDDCALGDECTYPDCLGFPKVEFTIQEDQST